ncbi:hypothetical protein [Flavobacterium sp. 25HG05S-40]|uniref:hypothetical protein n=1 Tax=Flavobacterium sp. 25HG05S-40 TaxID=3458682 RepID=UPI0040440F02
MYQHLNETEKEQLKKLRDTDYQTIVSGKDNGVPFLTYVFKLHFKLFGETCSSCPNKISGYIKKLKSFNTEKPMETKSIFKLKEGATLPVPGTSKVYSNANLTDEVAIEMLAKNQNRKALFASLPKDVDARIAKYREENQTETDGGKVVNFKVDNLVDIGDKKLTIEQATALLAKVGVETKATTVKGIQTAIGKLDAVKMEELQTLALEVKDETIVDSNQDGGDGLRTKEDVEFDLAKAQQDLEDLEASEPKDEAAINTKAEEIATLVGELKTFE